MRTDKQHLTARCVLAALAALAATFVFASTASASATFGSDLSETADTTPTQCIFYPSCPSPTSTYLMVFAKAGNAFPLLSPKNGVITRFGIESASTETVTFRLLAYYGSAEFNNATGDITGPTTTVGPGITFVPAHTLVHTGDRLGIDVPDNPGMYSLSSDPSCGTTPFEQTLTYNPQLTDGGSPQPDSSESTCELLVNATVEPDADGDGYGDETQDLCPSDATTHGKCPPLATPVKKCKKKSHKRSAVAAKKHKCKKKHKH